MRDPTRRALKLVNALIGGAELDRAEAAELLGVDSPRGYAVLRMVESHVAGVSTRKVGRTSLFRLRFPGSAYTFEMAVAACFTSGLSSLLIGTRFESAMRSVLEQVLARSSDPEAFCDADRKFYFLTRGGEVGLPGGATMLEQLAEAVVRQVYVRLEYANFEGVVEPREQIKPLSIAVYNHQLYVVAELADGRRRHYRFSRIVKVRLGKRHFSYPARASYDPQTHFRHSFGVYQGAEGGIEEVVVRLAQRWWHYADTHSWHPSQRVRQEKGHVLVHLDVRVCPELEAWILSFGEDAEVMAPASLRRRIGGRTKALARVYS